MQAPKKEIWRVIKIEVLAIQLPSSLGLPDMDRVCRAVADVAQGTQVRGQVIFFFPDVNAWAIVTMPEGQLKIAQRFIVGLAVSPESGPPRSIRRDRRVPRFPIRSAKGVSPKSVPTRDPASQ